MNNGNNGKNIPRDCNPKHYGRVKRELSNIENSISDIKAINPKIATNEDYNTLNKSIDETFKETIRVLQPLLGIRVGGNSIKTTYKNKRKTRKPRKSKPTRKQRSPRIKNYYY
jgi:hypothetical protein